jgi:hypothetical protein
MIDANTEGFGVRGRSAMSGLVCEHACGRGGVCARLVAKKGICEHALACIGA